MGILRRRRRVDLSSPAPDTPVESLPLLAVDVETTGLDRKKDRLLSIGWVPLDGRVIDLSGAREVILRDTVDHDAGVGESATLHGLTDDTVAAGIPAGEALGELIEVIRGRALLAHFAVMETGFLDAVCRRELGMRFEVPVVDTLDLERRHMERMGTYPRGEDLRLPRVRERYGLPTYRSHRAVTDALACAELYLAITAPDGMTRQYRTLRSVSY